MENKFNIEEVNAWLKEEHGMSYDELSKEFNKAVDLLSESLKQRKEMRNKIDKTIEYLEEKYSCYAEDDEMQKDELLDILKEDK